jgi:transcriptional regulator with XRE-family HTH domain
VARTSGKLDEARVLARIGDAIRGRRAELDLSQEALSDLAGIDRSHMGKIERGERNVTLLVLCKIAQALRCELSEILLRAGL